MSTHLRRQKKPFVSGVLLAAGEATRWEKEVPKQLSLLGGEPLVRILARRALESSLGELVAVIGHMAESMRAALSDLDLKIVVNALYMEGLSSSVKLGLRSIDPSADAAIFMPADQPFLDTAVLQQLIATYEGTGARIVVPAYKGRMGSPRLFDRSLFPELTTITGDEGGRQLLGHRKAEIVTVPLDSEKPLLDIDTVEDYRQLLDKHQ